MVHRVALIVGANGIVGNALVEHFVKNTTDQEWSKIIAISKRPPQFGLKDKRLHCASVDLSRDEETIKKELLKVGISEVTHAYYVTYVHSKTWDEKEMIDKNVPMFKNFLRALDSVAPKLERVALQTGCKAYGIHLHPAKVLPTPETEKYKDAGPSFYKEQEDFLREYQKSKRWGWNVQRPNNIIGITKGNGMSLAPSLAVYFLVQKELGKKAAFPGSKITWNAITDFSTASLIADFTVWASIQERTINNDFNIIDSNELPRTSWKKIWTALGHYFGVEIEEPGEKAKISLADYMKDKEQVWKSIVAKKGGHEKTWEATTMEFVDAITGFQWDAYFDESKAMNFGWNTQINSIEGLASVLNKMKEEGMIPKNEPHEKEKLSHKGETTMPEKMKIM